MSTRFCFCDCQPVTSHPPSSDLTPHLPTFRIYVHRIQAVEFLISQKADLDVTNPYEFYNTALVYAVQEACLPCVKVLLDAGASPLVPKGVTILRHATSKAKSELFDLLLDAGADV